MNAKESRPIAAGGQMRKASEATCANNDRRVPVRVPRGQFPHLKPAPVEVEARRCAMLCWAPRVNRYASVGELNAHRLAAAWRFAIASARRRKPIAITTERLEGYARFAWPVPFALGRLDAERVAIDALHAARIANG